MEATKAKPIEKPIFFDMPELIETERLILRKPDVLDSPSLNEAVGETFEQLSVWMPWATEPVPLAATEEFIRTAIADFAARKAFIFCILEKATGRMLGSMGYQGIDWTIPSFEIGYWIRASAQRQGLVSEAVSRLTRLAIDDLDVKRVYLRIDAKNIPSRSVAQHCKFQLEGTLRNEAVDNDGNLRSTEIWSIVPGQC